MFSLTRFQVSSHFPQVCPGGHPHNRIRLHETLHHVTLSRQPVVLQCLFSLFVWSFKRVGDRSSCLCFEIVSHRYLTDWPRWPRGTIRFLARYAVGNVRVVFLFCFVFRFTSAPALLPRVDQRGISLCLSHRNGLISLQLDFQLLRFSSTSYRILMASGITYVCVLQCVYRYRLYDQKYTDVLNREINQTTYRSRYSSSTSHSFIALDVIMLLLLIFGQNHLKEERK